MTTKKPWETFSVCDNLVNMIDANGDFLCAGVSQKVAAEILQAVNAHEALVEALEDSNSLLNSLISGEATEMIVAQIADNLAALALAGVKEVKGE